MTINVLPEVNWFADSNGVMNIPRGKLGGFRMRENPTTGYQWKIKEEESTCMKQVYTKYN